jgi:hypothetical protein
MSFDISRKTFDAWKNYFGVAMQQGRVQLDSDWNEWLAELARRLQAGTLDTVGATGVPSATPSGFKITVDSSTPPQTTIGYGRIYVDGILAENHRPKGSDMWDPALAEWSGSAPSGVDVNSQPWLTAGPLPTDQKPYLLYLDVWQREVTYLEDPSLVDAAVGLETTGRLQTVWQVKYLDVSSVAVASCSNPGDPWTNQIQPSAGLLTTDIGGAAAALPGPCSLSATAGYTGLENQLYRVEIHEPSSTGQPTFKWSRDNATVTTAVTAISGNVLSVQSLGKDQMLAFIPGNWIEITNDSLELNGLPGNLCQIYSIDATANTITLVSPPGIAFSQPDTLHTRITRWDQAGTVYRRDGTVWADLNAVGSTGIPVPPPPVAPSLPIALVLENGITVAFDLATTGGSFQPGDFWTFTARTANGSVETLTKAPPFGIYHHYCGLSIVDFRSSPPSFTDCRQVFPALSNPSIRVYRVQTAGGAPLLNGGTANVSDLANGINVVCDLPVDPTVFTNANIPNSSFSHSPVCFLTVDVPNVPSTAASGAGYNSLVLAATVSVSPSNTINWIPPTRALARRTSTSYILFPLASLCWRV